MGGFAGEYLLKFPKAWQFKSGDAIDEVVKAFSRNHAESLRAIRGVIVSAIGTIRWGLSHTPWVLLIALVILIAWRLTKRLSVGIFFALMLFFIGCC